MVRVVVVRIGVSILADGQAPPWAWGKQVHLVRVDEHGAGLSLQPERAAREVTACGASVRTAISRRFGSMCFAMLQLLYGWVTSDRSLKYGGCVAMLKFGIMSLLSNWLASDERKQ